MAAAPGDEATAIIDTPSVVTEGLGTITKVVMTAEIAVAGPGSPGRTAGTMVPLREMTS